MGYFVNSQEVIRIQNEIKIGCESRKWVIFPTRHGAFHPSCSLPLVAGKWDALIC